MEEAKAIEKGLEVTQDLYKGPIGRFLGNSFEAFIGDKMWFYRESKFLELQEKLGQKKITNFKTVSPAIGIPMLDYATLEDNENLQQYWANLIANAIDADFKSNMHRSFSKILSELEPVDAQIMEVVYKLKTNKLRGYLVNKEFLKKELGSNFGIEISLRNLLRLGLIKPGVVVIKSIMAGPEPMTAYKDINMFDITELGISFCKAVQDNRS